LGYILKKKTLPGGLFKELPGAFLRRGSKNGSIIGPRERENVYCAEVVTGGVLRYEPTERNCGMARTNGLPAMRRVSRKNVQGSSIVNGLKGN